ncbi:MAG: 2-hydroxyacid dehydrogenase [Notoacmeibacter sp.]|nr:2-hydroxyacid dehydrogenase [Notoacmeibacter sp.]
MTRNLLVIGSATPRMMDQFSKMFTVHFAEQGRTLAPALAGKADQIVAVSTYGDRGIGRDLIAALPNLEIISSYGVGYDGIDVQAAIDRGIMVTHTPNVLNADVANTAIMLMLAVSRRLVVDDAYVRAGRWAREGAAPLRRSIEGKKVGILGLGRIGETIAEKLQVFDCEVVYHSRNPKPEVSYEYYGNLVMMAGDCDYLVVVTPGGSATRKLVGREVIEALGPEGTLINIARGTVVDEAELVAALQDGRLGAAGLDVFENEPHVPEALFAMENVVLTPHVGSATEETRRAMGDLVVENIVRFFNEGKAVTPVPECRGM